MKSSPEIPYKVSPVPKARQQIDELAQRAKLMGSFRTFVTALEWVLLTLHQSPANWGDPLYNTKHPGGVVCRGFHLPLSVHYALYEADKAVLILDVELILDSETNGSA